MKRRACSLRVCALAVLILGLSLCFTVNTVFSQEENSGPGARLSDGELRLAAEVQRSHEAQLFSIPGVVGVGIGLTEGKDALALHVYLNGDVPGASAAVIPSQV